MPHPPPPMDARVGELAEARLESVDADTGTSTFALATMQQPRDEDR